MKKRASKPKRSGKPDFETRQTLEKQDNFEERNAFDQYASAVINGLVTRFTWDELKANAAMVALSATRIAGEMVKARRIELNKEGT